MDYLERAKSFIDEGRPNVELEVIALALVAAVEELRELNHRIATVSNNLEYINHSIWQTSER